MKISKIGFLCFKYYLLYFTVETMNLAKVHDIELIDKLDILDLWA